jgi:hypothetical protein
MAAESNSGGGGSARERRKAERALVRAVKVLGLTEPPSRVTVAAVPGPTLVQKFLGVIEQPLCVLPVGVVAGLIGVFLWTPVLGICGICILLAFHRSKLADGKPRTIQLFWYACLAAVVTLALGTVDHLIAKGMKRNKEEIVDSVVSGVRKALGISGNTKLIRITKFNVKRYPKQRSVQIDVFIRSSSYAEALQVNGSYRIFVESDILSDVPSERKLEARLWEDYTSSIDKTKENEATVTVLPDTESYLPIGNTLSEEDFLSLNQKVIYFMGRVTFQDLDGKTQHTEFCGFSSPTMPPSDAALCKYHNG